MRGKKWLAMALVLAFMCSLTACASKTEEHSANADESSPAAATDAAENQDSGEKTENVADITGDDYEIRIVSTDDPVSAYQTFLDAVSFIENDSDWEEFIDAYRINAAQRAERYSYLVNGAAEEDWDSMSYYERFLYQETYLEFAWGIYVERYDYYFGSVENFKEAIADSVVSAIKSVANQEEAAQVLNAYLDLASWQYSYVQEHGAPYNFINNCSYYEEVAGSGGETEAAAPETSEADGFTIAHLSSDSCEIVGCTLGYSAAIDSLVVPDTINGRTVIGIGSGAFVNNLAKEITLPDTVEYISEKAFLMCSMETRNLGSGLKKIAQAGILSCNELTALTFPEGMESMGASSFGGAGALAEVYIPASVTDIGQDSSGQAVITYPASCPNVVIVTPSGSLAEEVALANKLTVRNP